MKFIKISTDGGYLEGKNVGAISFVVVDNRGNLIAEYSRLMEEEVVNDNNIMEIQAICKALNWVRSNGFSPNEYRVYLYTDSQNVQLALAEYFKIWKENEWKSSVDKPIGNVEIWERLYQQFSSFKSIHISWIPKKDGYIWNVRADQLCDEILEEWKMLNGGAIEINKK